MTEIRNLQQEDFHHLLTIETESFNGGYSPYFIKMIPVLFGNVSYIALEGDKALGYAAASIEQGEPSRGWIISMAVRPQARGQNLGKQLMLASLAALKQAGVRTVQLTVAPANKFAINLYQQLGFTEAGHMPDYFGPGQHRLLMIKNM